MQIDKSNSFDSSIKTQSIKSNLEVNTEPVKTRVNTNNAAKILAEKALSLENLAIVGMSVADIDEALEKRSFSVFADLMFLNMEDTKNIFEDLKVNYPDSHNALKNVLKMKLEINDAINLNQSISLDPNDDREIFKKLYSKLNFHMVDALVNSSKFTENKKQALKALLDGTDSINTTEHVAKQGNQDFDHFRSLLMNEQMIRFDNDQSRLRLGLVFPEDNQSFEMRFGDNPPYPFPASDIARQLELKPGFKLKAFGNTTIIDDKKLSPEAAKLMRNVMNAYKVLITGH